MSNNFQNQSKTLMSYVNSGRIDLAIECIDELFNILPKDPSTSLQLAHLCLEIGAVGHSVKIIQRLVSIVPDDKQLRFNLATAYLFCNDYANAKIELENIADSLKSNADALNMMGSCYSGLGDFTAAESIFKQALGLNPSHGGAALNLVKCRRFEAQDKRFLTSLQETELTTNDPMQTIKLCKAIAKIQNDLGEFEGAWQYAKKANSKLYQLSPYKGIKARRESLEYLKHFALKEHGDANDEHLLIVGMPRSGTTLLEQKIGCHPFYFQGGETPAIEFALQYGLHTGSFEQANDASKGAFRKAANGYRFYFQQMGSQGDMRFINKLPANYAHIGFFKQMFPKGKVIFVQRDYRDVVASIFFEEFSNPNSYTNRVQDIIAEYKLSLDLLSHWQRFYDESILVVRYEELVEDERHTTARIAEFLSLEQTDFDQHNQNETAVNTPSLWQVRQGIYQTSKARFKRYRALVDLPESLKPE